MAIFGKFDDLRPLFSKTQELEYLEDYIHSLFKPDFLSQIQTLKEGGNFRISLKHNMFAFAHCYTLKSSSEAFFESHQKYIDIQIVIDGAEGYLIGCCDCFVPIGQYDEKKDLTQYKQNMQVSEVWLQSGEICILFPQDIHAAGIGRSNEVEQNVKKVVIKVPISLIKHRL